MKEGGGVSEAELSKLNQGLKSVIPVPSSLDLSSLKARAEQIKSQNPGKENRVSDFLSLEAINSPWMLAGEIDNSGEHLSGSVFSSPANDLDLGNLVEGLGANTETHAFFNPSDTKTTSYLTVTVGNGNDRKTFRYRPSFYGQPKKTEGQQIDTGGLGVSNFAVEQKLGKISSDPWCGFTPECKPAIYLYPKTTQLINVKIGGKLGQRTITIPPYNRENGWSVLATKDGEIFWGGQKLSHLFYEAVTPRPPRPKTGWTVSGDNLNKDLKRVAQESGLNDRESREFARFWAKKLNPAPYYFVGLIPETVIEELEPLAISPQPDTQIRLRFYFAPLKEKTLFALPELKPAFRRGFTAVEWGGYAE